MIRSPGPRVRHQSGQAGNERLEVPSAMPAPGVSMALSALRTLNTDGGHRHFMLVFLVHQKKFNEKCETIVAGMKLV